MSNPRLRKAKKNIAAKILEPAGLTQLAEGDDVIPSRTENLLNNALYSTYGTNPTVTDASTTLLTDAVSNQTGFFTASGDFPQGGPWSADQFQTGETTDMDPSDGKNLVHYSLPRLRATQSNYYETTFSVGDTVVIYPPTGPRGKYANYYFTSSFDEVSGAGQAAESGTGSILFGASITASAGYLPGSVLAANHKYLNIYVAGELNSGSGDHGRDRLIISGGNNTIGGNGQVFYFNGSGSFSSGTLSLSTSSILDAEAFGGLEFYWSSSNASNAEPHMGVMIYVSSSNSDLMTDNFTTVNHK